MRRRRPSENGLPFSVRQMSAPELKQAADTDRCVQTAFRRRRRPDVFPPYGYTAASD
ncbi:hypothetical protein HMPREF9120_01947 [Neisseria sp. oral taxon 020 str. F0370]|nr:hypothetical protein HMPREF9120_01947 [Neisseria sp. oral taxon 020 str. F0370]